MIKVSCRVSILLSLIWIFCKFDGKVMLLVDYFTTSSAVDYENLELPVMEGLQGLLAVSVCFSLSVSHKAPLS